MKPTFKQKIIFLFKKLFTKQATMVLEQVETVTIHTGNTVEQYVNPVRQSILKRFPVLFTMLATSGVAATFLGVEQVLLQAKILEESPLLILILGLGILAFTGKLYKKLG